MLSISRTMRKQPWYLNELFNYLLNQKKGNLIGK